MEWQTDCMERVAIPFEVGQVSTISSIRLEENMWVAIPFEVGQVSTKDRGWQDDGKG